MFVSADTCHSLKTLDLRGFVTDAPSLGSLAERNRRQLGSVTLPASCEDEQLEELLRQLHVLTSPKFVIERPRGTGRWFRELPVTLQTLQISGELR